MVQKRTQLGPEDWVKAGFRLLAENGPGDLKAEIVARQLKTTKGSFYWHFKDVSAYHRSMLRIWEEQSTNSIIAQLDGTPLTGADKLVALARAITALNAQNEFGGLRAEPALRIWALSNTAAVKALQRVEANRVTYVASLFVEAGFNATVARSKAQTFYALFVGLQTLSAQQELRMEQRLLEGVELLLRT
jgi:AcrR family transcriptional regulator